MKNDVGNLLIAGLVLATLEVLATLVRGHALFLSVGEQVQYALTALVALSSCTLLCGLALRTGCIDTRVARVARPLLAAALALVVSVLLWRLTDGRRVHDAWWRVPAVSALGLVTFVVGVAHMRFVSGMRTEDRQRLEWFPGHAQLSVAALILTIVVLPRGYPAFHQGLLLLAVLALSFGALASPPVLPARALRRAPAAAVVVVMLAPYALWRLSSHPTLSFAVREKAPWTARLMTPFTPTKRRPLGGGAAPTTATRPSVQRGVDLRDRDVLLISVDALRADLLRAYGGTGRTPELDRLASESAVFLRAYTPAPHTSYALASLLTGKFVKPLVELGHKLGDPPTLPDRLRRYGYRTAAFYPPAIFFVDGASFEALHARGFGFEYRKEMFASADERVAQLDAYLGEADPKRPLFVWMHLFEPHEPYDPPPGVAHDSSERGRYEAEVRTCDRVIAELVRRFRAARPRATVIVTADHGEEFGDHGGSFHGTSLYDEQVRIPLLWSAPGVVPARTSEVPVELTDLGATLLSTAGIPRDAHMRGDDLSAVLAGADDAGPAHAFASIDGRHMVTDGKLKLICSADGSCALFDLRADPRELRNLAGALPARVEQLRGALDAFLASIARTEAVTVSAGVSLPDALARAKLGATITADELLPLLDDPRAAVRSESARVLGELAAHAALPRLNTARLHDSDAVVRAEATISALQLGDTGAAEDALALLRTAAPEPDRVGRARRAALALAGVRRAESVPVLAALVRDEQATESERLRAVRALGGLGTELAVAPLIETLSVVRLREASALALAELGGPDAIAALRAQLAEERYPPARGAEARALEQLAAPGLAPLVRRYLGMESSLPHGVRILSSLSELTPSTRQGALLADASVRRGGWTCTESGCTPEREAALVLPRRGPRAPSAVRVTLWYRAPAPGAALLVDGVRMALSPSEDQLSFERPTAASAERFSISREGDVSLLGVTVLPSLPEIPPPAPEPWASDAGVAPAADAGTSTSMPAR